MLKLIHTSDWHLGSTLHEIDRHNEHQAFLDWLLARLVEEEADVLLVAGDVFDSANPPAEALRLLCGFLGAARERLPCLQTILTGGNHDSAIRLEAPRELFALANALVVGAWPWTGEGWDRGRLCLPLRDKEQKIAAWLGAVPFMRPGDLYRFALTTAQAEGQELPLAQAVGRLYAEVAESLRERRREDQALILTGHLYASGGKLSDSVRSIQRGNLEAIPPEIFPPDVAYVALGHLHLAQAVGGADHVRYSGSPLPLSFSEIDYKHQVLAVTFEAERCTEVRPLAIPRFRDLRRIPSDGPPGEKSVVLQALKEFSKSAGDSGAGCHLWPLVEARVRLCAPDPQLRKDVEEALKDRAALLVRLEASFPGPEGRESAEEGGGGEQLENIGPEQVFARKWRDDYSAEPGEEIRRAFLEILETVQEGGEQ